MTDINTRLLRSYGETSARLILAEKRKSELSEEIEKLRTELAGADNDAKAYAEKMDFLVGIMYGDKGIHDESFTELYRRFDAIAQSLGVATDQLFGYTKQAVEYWKSGECIPRSNTWEAVADIIEKTTRGFFPKAAIIDALRRSSAERKAKKESESVQPETEAGSEELPIFGSAEMEAETAPGDVSERI